MKIVEIKTYLVNANHSAGWADRPRGRNWIFCRILTDKGIWGGILMCTERPRYSRDLGHISGV